MIENKRIDLAWKIMAYIVAILIGYGGALLFMYFGYDFGIGSFNGG